MKLLTLALGWQTREYFSNSVVLTQDSLRQDEVVFYWKGKQNLYFKNGAHTKFQQDIWNEFLRQTIWEWQCCFSEMQLPYHYEIIVYIFLVTSDLGCNVMYRKSFPSSKKNRNCHVFSVWWQKWCSHFVKNHFCPLFQ